MASKHPSLDFNFQYYVDSVRQKRIHWNVFEKLMVDLSYSDMNRLRHLNAILLTQLTISYSDMDRMKYLNVILMAKFKDSIEIGDNIEMSEHEHFEFSQKSIVDHDLNNERNDEIEISNDSEIHTSESKNENERKSFDLPNNEALTNFKDSEDAEICENELIEISQKLEDDQDLSDETIKKISKDGGLQLSVESENENEIDYEFESRYNEDTRCKSWDESISQGRDLKKPMDIVHEVQRDYKCESCGRSFTRLYVLERHLHTVHDGSYGGNKVQNIQIVNTKEIPQGNNLTNSHANENHKQNCNQADQTVHKGQKDHKCESCEKSFTLAKYLKRHIYTVHEGHKDHKCKSCGKSFSQACNLKAHINEVGHKDQKCKYCGKSLSQVSKLKNHIHTVHEGHKDYRCESCGKLFSEAGNLKRHKHTIHEGQKDYKCVSCAKSFSEARNLKKHIHTVHEGQKDYKCDTCAKSFTQLQSLERHLHTVHDGNKDHKCDSCGKSFSAAGSLKKHTYSHHS